MGFAVAEAARDRGAEVTVVVGATSVPAPDGVRTVQAVSAKSMHDAVMKSLPKATVYIGAAAVADYRPAVRASSKIKKKDEELTIVLERTTDILAEVARKRHSGLIVTGFAAETNDVVGYAKGKLVKKDLDLIVANDVSNKDTGFGSDMNKAFILRRDKRKALETELVSKRELADLILDQILDFRRKNAK
jgi:phosphopantothenoylcysteine decarboxylase/phosphopantothenate--cysteine ligase